MKRTGTAGRHVLPLLVLGLVAATSVAWLCLRDKLSWPVVGTRLHEWRADVSSDPVPAGLAYVAAYAGVVAVSLPIGAALSVLGGALFGVALGGTLAVFSASLGAVLLFLLARSTLGGWFASRAGPLIEGLRPALQQDGFAGLLALRLVPVVPFWLTNLAPALLGMRLLPFLVATPLGIAPATFILAGIGAGAADTLARGMAPDVSALFAAPILLPLLGLAALSLAPAAWRRWRARNA